jgi:hypothetical protein
MSAPKKARPTRVGARSLATSNLRDFGFSTGRLKTKVFDIEGRASNNNSQACRRAPRAQAGLDTTGSLSFRAINRAAINALRAVLGRLLPGGKTVGNEYVVRNPTRADRHAGSFRINVLSGRWADFATGDRGGDIISLVAYLEGVRQSEAARLVARMLGMKLNEPHHG